MKHYDLVGVGFGPSNIALAVALEELGAVQKVHFFEGAHSSRWQPNMLLAGSDIQNNPLRDLITPTNPRSHYTFTNYLKEHDRLFDYLNLGIHYPLRAEYSQYIEWVAGHFDRIVSYDTAVKAIRLRETNSTAAQWLIETSDGPCTASTVVVGTGRAANIPEQFTEHLGERIFHLTEYSARLEVLASQGLRSVAVLGASQSAVEILLDLMGRFPELHIHSIHRGFSMRQKDTSPFSDHVYFPDFIDYYYHLPEESKASLRNQLRQTNYSSADIDVIHQLYLRVHEEKIRGRRRFFRHNNTFVRTVSAKETSVHLEVEECHLGNKHGIDVDAVVLATGFKDIGSTTNCDPYPRLLAEIVNHLGTDNKGAVVVRRDYSIACPDDLSLYLNGLCENSHGMGDAGSFSLLSIRAAAIARSVMAARHNHPPISLRRQIDHEGAAPRETRGGSHVGIHF